MRSKQTPPRPTRSCVAQETASHHGTVGHTQESTPESTHTLHTKHAAHCSVLAGTPNLPARSAIASRPSIMPLPKLLAVPLFERASTPSPNCLTTTGMLEKIHRSFRACGPLKQLSSAQRSCSPQELGRKSCMMHTTKSTKAIRIGRA